MDVWASEGNIKTDLKPFQWSSGPWTEGNLMVMNDEGNTAIHMPMSDSPSMRKYLVSIRAYQGNITGEIMHGVETNLTSEKGSIDVVLLPYNVYGLYHSEIRTKTPQGNTKLQILDPYEDGIYYKDHVMNKTQSWHKDGTEKPGSMWLHHPPQWIGRLEGDVDSGKISLHESFDERTDFPQRHGSRISARKGHGNSNLIFHVGEGNAT